MSTAPEGVLLELRALCLGLPGTSERSSFGHPNFVVRNKAFATFEIVKARPSIAFRLPPAEVKRRLRQDKTRYFATPYGRGQWVSIWVDGEFNWQEVCELAIQAHAGVP